MAKLTEVVEVSTTAVQPSEELLGQGVDEFKRVCEQRGLVVEGDPKVVMTSFTVGQKARFSVTAECKSPGAKQVKPEVKET